MAALFTLLPAACTPDDGGTGLAGSLKKPGASALSASATPVTGRTPTPKPAGTPTSTPTPSATPTPSPEPSDPHGGIDDGGDAGPMPTPTVFITPTPAPTAAPTAVITSMTVSPATYIQLFPPAQNPAAGLGYPIRQQLTGKVSLEGGATGAFTWVNESNGALSIDSTGVVSVNPGTAAGAYTIRLQPVDDPNQSLSVTVIVTTPSALDVTVN